jgi:hypothetical protein
MAVRRIRINASWVKFSPNNIKENIEPLAIFSFIQKLDQLHEIYNNYYYSNVNMQRTLLIIN